MNDVWSWQVVHAAGGVHVKLLPCRTEKLAHWLICPAQEGLEVVEATLVHLDQAAICVLCWPSQAWCCSHNQLGCEGGAGCRKCESRVKKDILWIRFLWVTEIILKYVPLSFSTCSFSPRGGRFFFNHESFDCRNIITRLDITESIGETFVQFIVGIGNPIYSCSLPLLGSHLFLTNSDHHYPKLSKTWTTCRCCR